MGSCTRGSSSTSRSTSRSTRSSSRSTSSSSSRRDKKVLKVRQRLLRRMRPGVNNLFTFLGVFGVISGIISFAAFDSLYQFIMKKQMVVKEGSYSYDMWKTTPIPMFNKIYYFNCTNVSACKYNSPAYVSLPHFHLADPA